MKRTSWSAGLSVSGDGVGVVAHAGSVAVRLLADRTGLTAELSKAMARRSFVPVHDRGRVLTDVAVMLAGGGEAIADIEVLRHQSSVLGPVASPPTVWRALDEVTPGRLRKIQASPTTTLVGVRLDFCREFAQRWRWCGGSGHRRHMSQDIGDSPWSWMLGHVEGTPGPHRPVH